MFRRTLSWLIVFAALLAGARDARGDYLVVRRAATLKRNPQSDAEIRLALGVDGRLDLLEADQTNGYYHAKEVQSGASGWVYRTFVRRYPGDAPVTLQPVTPETARSEDRGDLESGLARTTEAVHDEAVFDNYDPYDPNGRWYTYAGTPKADGYPNKLTVLKNTGYVVGYDETRHDPAWACYRCFRFVRAATPARPSWKTDKRTTFRIATTDYAGSDYTRGHMAPNYAIFQCYGRTAQLETFLMTNVCPQYQTNNDGIWGDLEDLAANTYAQEFGEVWIICGPIFKDGATPKTIGRGVQVPAAFFMIMVDEEGGKPHALAFKVPHTDDRGTEPKNYLASIDDIEQATHLDFLAELPDDIEASLEASKASALWPVQSHN